MHILEAEIQTNDLPGIESFYSTVLGFKTKQKKETSVSFLVGQSTLSFLHAEAGVPKYHFAFNIPSNKLDEAIEWVSKKTTLISVTGDDVIAHFDNWNAKSIYFYDSIGNILEFIVRFDLNNPSDKPFDSYSILSLNEMGVVTDRPLAFAEDLIEEQGLEYFWRGPKREDFVAVGDDNGLIIIAATNRNWYPTDIPSAKHYLSLTFMTKGVTRQITVNRPVDMMNQ
jgi:catechol 2,3-dioxygenase-like lactoylglutathione lyase family enzyme